jgi:hypothetical protein
VDVSEAEGVTGADMSPDAPEETIDRKRDVEYLKAFLKTLPAKDRKEFWTGTRADLTERAKAYVEKQREAKGTKP